MERNENDKRNREQPKPFGYPSALRSKMHVRVARVANPLKHTQTVLGRSKIPQTMTPQQVRGTLLLFTFVKALFVYRRQIDIIKLCSNLQNIFYPSRSLNRSTHVTLHQPSHFLLLLQSHIMVWGLGSGSTPPPMFRFVFQI